VSSQSRPSSWLDVRLTTLDEQLRQIDTAVREQHHSQLRVHELENQLRQMLDRGAHILAGLAQSDPTRRAAEEQTRRRQEWEVLETRLRDASERRIHEFERRLEHEWQAIRQLHEIPIKALEERAADAQAVLSRLEQRSQGLNEELLQQLTTARDPRRETPTVDTAAPPTGPDPALLTYLLLIALMLLAAYTGAVHWRLSAAAGDARTRARGAEQQAAETAQLAGQETRAATDTIERVKDATLAAAARTERMLNVLTASDLRRFTLFAQPAARVSAGQALSSRSHGVVLTLTRLQRSAPDQVHQVWLITSRGTFSLGFASPDAQGRVSEAFDVPPDLPGTVLGVMVTLEPAGGNRAPSGPIEIVS
jgi:anti-sigma-K factor RskA